MLIVWVSLKSCVRYFSLFLKYESISSLFRTKYIEKKFDLSCFFFPSFHEHSLSLELPRAARLLKTSWFEKWTAWVIETMLMTLTFSQIKKITNRSQPTKSGTNQDKHRERSSNLFKWFKKLSYHLPRV